VDQSWEGKETKHYPCSQTNPIQVSLVNFSSPVCQLDYTVEYGVKQILLKGITNGLF